MRRPSRRARFSRASRLIVRCAVALTVVGAAAVVDPASTLATSGVDDYPPRLKRADQNALVDPWLFYNRECTSFVAWRLNNDAGVSFTNYYLDVHWGDASNWRHAAGQADVTVSDRPAVGAVAWWRAGSAGSSRGHVAWVHRVSQGEITVEEYNYLVTGGYDIRSISRSSSVWPSAFIHIGDIAMDNLSAPSIAGEPRVGERLIADRGTWRPRGADFTYQWLADGAPIDGATGKAFMPHPVNLGQRIQVRVTAEKPGVKTRTALSARTREVRLGLFTPIEAPAISGTAKVGRMLSATRGNWSPEGRYLYRWFAGGKRVRGAHVSTFTPSASQLHLPVTVRVTVKRGGYRPAHSSSSPTDAVAPGTFRNETPPSIDGTAKVGAPLAALRGEWSPRGAARFRWLADGAPLPGATHKSYTPVAADLGRQLTVEVTLHKAGYIDRSATAAYTAPVARGDFTTVGTPRVVGKAQVGVRLKADPGEWSPKPRLKYQWYDGDHPIAGATDSTYTPTPDKARHQISVQVTAHRRGYNTVVAMSPPTSAVALGVIHNLRPPKLSGRAIVGHAVTASTGAWSITPDKVRYQWRIDGHRVLGATSARYVLAARDGGHRVSVRVIVRADGYAASSQTSAPIRVLFGRASFAHRPVIRGQAIVGRTLTARTGAHRPRIAAVTYHWYRDDDAIRHAVDSTYEVRARDVGHHLRVQVTLHARYWEPATRMSPRTAAVQPAV